MAGSLTVAAMCNVLPLCGSIGIVFHVEQRRQDTVQERFCLCSECTCMFVSSIEFSIPNHVGKKYQKLDSRAREA